MRHNIYAYRHKVARKRKNKQYTKGVYGVHLQYQLKTNKTHADKLTHTCGKEAAALCCCCTLFRCVGVN